MIEINKFFFVRYKYMIELKELILIIVIILVVLTFNNNQKREKYNNDFASYRKDPILDKKCNHEINLCIKNLKDYDYSAIDNKFVNCVANAQNSHQAKKILSKHPDSSVIMYGINKCRLANPLPAARKSQTNTDTLKKCLNIMEVSDVYLDKNDIKHNTPSTCSMLDGSFELVPKSIPLLKTIEKNNNKEPIHNDIDKSSDNKSTIELFIGNKSVGTFHSNKVVHFDNDVKLHKFEFHHNKEIYDLVVNSKTNEVEIYKISHKKSKDKKESNSWHNINNMEDGQNNINQMANQHITKLKTRDMLKLLRNISHHSNIEKIKKSNNSSKTNHMNVGKTRSPTHRLLTFTLT